MTKAGCSKFALGCLLAILINLLITAVLIGGGYYLFSQLKKTEPGSYFEVDNPAEPVTDCNSSLGCVEQSLIKCNKATGKTALGEFADIYLEVVGKSGTSCVVYAKITEIKEFPETAIPVPDFVINAVLKDLSAECLIPRDVYIKGMEEIGQYISENIEEVCEGPLFDITEKLGIDLNDI